MLLTITTTHQPATDLGYLLHKNPAGVQSFSLAFGQAHVFYPHATPERCTAALLLDIDPVGLVRRRGSGSEGFALEQYVNDRPYVASSFLSVAIAEVYGTALTGRSKERPELADTAIPLVANLSVLPSRGGESFLRRLFEPLGYSVVATRHPLDEHFPEWGESRYFSVELSATTRLRDLLAHLYVLIPVLDDAKHYFVAEDEVAKLLRRGEGWLATHPERTQITERYLKRKRSLVRSALAQLTEETEPEGEVEAADREEEQVEARISLNQQRIGAVLATLKAAGATTVLDLGCGEGQLLRALLADPSFTRITGMDVSVRALEMASSRLRLERMPPKQRERVQLLHGSLVYRDERLTGYDAAAVVEVIEHLDAPRLRAFERTVFAHACPRTVVLTTPNAEYNVRFESLPAGRFRHRDHRFEWTRAEFQAWAAEVAALHAYSVRFVPVGTNDAEVGAPTQMAVFTRV